MFDQEIPDYVTGPQRIRRAGSALGDQIAPGIERMTGYVSPKRKAMAIAEKVDLSSQDSIRNTWKQLNQLNPKAATAWLKDVTSMETPGGSTDLSNLGEHYRDAINIKKCAPGDKRCAQEAMDLVMQFKKPETALTAGLGKGATDKLWDGFGKAEKARGSIIAINSAMRELDKGTITGSFSGIRQDVSNLLYTMGLTKDPSILNTKKFIADTGKLVLNILGSGDLGAGTGLSDKDVEFANTVAGANTDIPPEALFRILDMNRRANQAVIDRHNKWSSSLDLEQIRRAGIGNVDFTVKSPEYYEKVGVDPEGEMNYGVFTIK